jgi:hypothetical protein
MFHSQPSLGRLIKIVTSNSMENKPSLIYYIKYEFYRKHLLSDEWDIFTFLTDH